MTLQDQIPRSARTASAVVALAILAQSPSAVAARASWAIDPARTHIAFAVDAVGYPRTKGEFRRFEGRVAVDLEHWERSSVVFHVQSQSVDVGSASFSDYLRSVAFLDSARFPSIDFVSNAVEKVDDHTVRVSGDLTLLGVTKPLSVEVAVKRETEGGRSRLAFLVHTRIDRLEFGMNSGFPLVSRDIELAISSEATEP